MAALTADRNTTERSGVDFSHPVAAATVIFAGSIVALNAAGDAVPGDNVATLVPIGRAEQYIDNSAGAAGDASIAVKAGVFSFENDATLTRAHIGDLAYLIDDQTVGVAGDSVGVKIVDVDTDGVWVKLGL